MRSPRLWWLGFLGLMAEASIAAERLPVFDAHIHDNADPAEALSVAEALGILERAGISGALVSSTPKDGTLALYRAAPDRIVPLLRPYRTTADSAPTPGSQTGGSAWRPRRTPRAAGCGSFRPRSPRASRFGMPRRFSAADIRGLSAAPARATPREEKGCI